MSNNKTDIILFVGAGFSASAGVPLMSKFVTLFENKLKEKGDNFHRYFLTIKKYINEVSGNEEVDLEKLMDILYRLAEGSSVEMSAWQEKNELTAFDAETRKATKLELENLIREKCIIDSEVKLDDYAPLNDVFKAKIKVKRERVPVDNYLVLLRTKEVQRYYDKEYQDKYIDQYPKA